MHYYTGTSIESWISLFIKIEGENIWNCLLLEED